MPNFLPYIIIDTGKPKVKAFTITKIKIHIADKTSNQSRFEQIELLKCSYSNQQYSLPHCQ